MGNKERRIAPRKECTVPLRFRVARLTDPLAREGARSSFARTSTGIIEGESVNLSERGIYFKSPHRVSVGESLEMYFTIPRELTGRSAEQVRLHCESGTRGTTGRPARIPGRRGSRGAL